MAGLRLLFLTIALALPVLIFGEIGNPFHLNALHFNDSVNVSLNSEVYLSCEYFLFAPTSKAFAMIISFVPTDELAQTQIAEVSSRSFLFPKELEMAHKDNGRVLNVCLPIIVLYRCYDKLNSTFLLLYLLIHDTTI